MAKEGISSVGSKASSAQDIESITFLTHREEGGRFRLRPFIPFFNKNGIRVEVTEIPNRPIARLRILWRLGDYTAVVIQKKTLGPLDRFVARRRARRIIYDFDDAIMYRSSRHGNQNSSLRMRRFAGMIGLADMVMPGNAYLAEQASRFISRDRIAIMPTVVDVTEYEVKDYAKTSDDFIIGWIGSASTVQYLQAIAPAIAAVAKRVRNTKLKIVCNTFIDIRGVTVLKKPWRAEDVSRDLTSFDVGIMPIPDDPWTRGKCGFKLVQYLASGVPVVASPVGVNLALAVPGKTGFLAENLLEWEKGLVEIAANRQLRMNMGLAGRRLIEESFSLQAASPRYLDILKTVVTMNRRRP